MKLFWWRQHEDSRNLGDEIGPLILRERFGVKVSRSSRYHAEAIGTGSILNWVYENREKRATSSPLSVLGSGLMYPQVDLSEVSYLEYFGVRGYLTRSCISRTDSTDIKIGDPGLLVSDLFASTKETPSFQLGIIPHVGFQNHDAINERIAEAKANGISVKLLDIATDDHQAFFAELQSCATILSQSLHGLIFADSFGIPNIWWDDRLLNSRGGRFKFYDYFSSISRPFNLRLSREFPLDVLSIQELAFVSSLPLVEQVRRDIRTYHKAAIAAIGERQ